MEYYVYILYSKISSKYYVGQTANIDIRLKRHNLGIVPSTISGTPWELVLQIKVSDRSEAMILERKIFTSSQTGLDRKERKKNIADAFNLKRKVNIYRENILLVDDVLTTGATLNECARVLKQYGAGKVVGITLAAVP